MKNKLLFLLVAVLVLAVGGYFLLGTNAHFGIVSNPKVQQVLSPTHSASSGSATISVPADTIQYQGVAGKDALSLLKEKASVQLASSGLVTAINGRKAIDSKHEYWAFYVNGKLAPVGPATYTTKSGDIILWKIETY